MKLNTHQQQLLQILNIKTLNLHADFLSFAQNHDGQATVVAPTDTDVLPQVNSAEITPVAATETIKPEPLLSPQLLQLQQDIQLLLTQIAPELQWQTGAELSASYRDGQLLHTPPIAALQQSEQKRQLWQLLNKEFIDV